MSLGLLGLLAVIVLILLAVALHKNGGAKMIVLFLATFFSQSAWAGVSVVLPDSVNQGGFFQVVIKGAPAGDVCCSVEFLGKSYDTFLIDEGAYAALIPVGVSERATDRLVYVTGGTFRRIELIKIQRVRFRTSKTIFERLPYTVKELDQLKRESELLKKIYFTETAERFFSDDVLFRSPLGGVAPLQTAGFGDIRKVKVKKNPELYIVRHYGIDYPVQAGTPVFAAENGIVRFVGELLGAGRTVILDHGHGLFSVYEHISQTVVNEGDLVLMGHTFAYSGKTGNATGPNLHFGVKLHNVWVDPKYFLGGAR